MLKAYHDFTTATTPPKARRDKIYFLTVLTGG